MIDIEATVRKILVEQLGVDAGEVTREASLVEDLGADSLDVVEIAMALEEEFGIEIPDEDLEAAGTPATATVGRLIDLVERKLAAKV